MTATTLETPAWAERFWRSVRRGAAEVCWPWQAHTSQGGYGELRVDGRTTRAHRASWVLANGPIPDGMQVLHTCDHRRCVNPGHLRLGTHQDNVDDKVRKGRAVVPTKAAAEAARAKTHCKRGHLFAGDNLKKDHRGRRRCGACRRTSKAAHAAHAAPVVAS